MWRLVYILPLIFLFILALCGEDWGFWKNLGEEIGVLGSFASIFGLGITIVELILTRQSVTSARNEVQKAKGEVIKAHNQMGLAQKDLEKIQSEMNLTLDFIKRLEKTRSTLSAQDEISALRSDIIGQKYARAHLRIEKISVYYSKIVGEIPPFGRKRDLKDAISNLETALMLHSQGLETENIEELTPFLDDLMSFFVEKEKEIAKD